MRRILSFRARYHLGGGELIHMAKQMANGGTCDTISTMVPGWLVADLHGFAAQYHVTLSCLLRHALALQIETLVRDGYAQNPAHAAAMAAELRDPGYRPYRSRHFATASAPVCVPPVGAQNRTP